MGFFFSDKAQKSSAKSSKLPVNAAKTLKCKVCPRNRWKLVSPKMEPFGAINPSIYFVATQPSKDDDLYDAPLYGARGDILFHSLPDSIINDSRIGYVLRCYANKKPEAIELLCCESFLREDIERTKPELIITLGVEPLAYFIGTGDVVRWRGRFTPVKVGSHTTWLFASMAPDYVIAKHKFNKRSNKKDVKTEYDHMFDLDITHAVNTIRTNTLSKPFVYEKDFDKGIDYVTGRKSKKDLDTVITWLNEAKTWGPHALDIETNGLRPYMDNPKILSMAIGTFDKAYAFPIDYPRCWTEEQLLILKAAIKDYLLFSDTKIAHYLGFEQEWLSFKEFFGTDILYKTTWEDTLAQAYCLDERKGMKALDVLCQLYFGFNLKPLTNLDRANLIQAPLSKLLPYNGMDVKWTHALWLKQPKQIKKHKKLTTVYKELVRSTPTLVKAQQVGLVIDYDLRDEYEKKMQEEITELTKRIKALPEVIEYEYRWATRFNPDSPSQVLRLLTLIYKLDEEIQDKDGKQGTGETILDSLDEKKYPIGKLILKFRAVTKKYGTYIEPLVDHAYPYDGRLHTNFNLFETSTGRLSSSNPNVQNWPHRKGKIIRRLIIAPKDSWIVAADYGQIEARIIGYASQDPVFCDALWNNYDIHMVWAKKIARAYPDVIGGSQNLDNEKRLKSFRKDIKNQWVFPAFYGSSPYSIARSVGIPIDVALVLFKDFWNTFKGVKKWQKWVTDFYNKHGYVETLTGRRRHGPMSYNKFINSPIQGTASDICVNAMNHLSENGYDVIMNIHDDVTSYIQDKNMENSIDEIVKIMCTSPYELLPGLNVPISIELSAGANWCDQEDLGTFSSEDFVDINPALKSIKDVYTL